MNIRTLVLLVYLPFLTLSMRINFHLTNSSCSEHNIRTASLHDCFSAAVWPSSTMSQPQQIIQYCLDQCLTKDFNQLNDHQSQLSFSQLAEQNVSSHQLYLWSAPIDLVERYQIYLDQPPSFFKTSMETNSFYNCTWPRFGPWCEYIFDFDESEQIFGSLSEFIHQFYVTHRYEPKTLTCYEHLQCNRGPSPSCLDWTEICDGYTDCLDGGKDEENCDKREG